MVRRDTNLKKAYTLTRDICCPALALTSVGKAIFARSKNTRTGLGSNGSNVDMESIIKALKQLKLFRELIGEASIDIVRCYVWAMLTTEAAKGAL